MRYTITHRMTIDLIDRDKSGESPRDESLICIVNVGEREILLAYRDAVHLAQVNNFPSRDPIHTIFSGRSPDLAPFHHEEIRSVAGTHKSMNIEHKRLVRPRVQRLIECDHFMQFA